MLDFLYNSSFQGCKSWLMRLRTPKRGAIPIPPAPEVLLSNSKETYHVYRPLDRTQDSPLGTIYRIYWAIVMDDTVAMRNDIEYFWSRKEECWAIRNIPQPPDHDPQRFAIVSAIPFLLAASFNRIINLGLPRSAAAGFLTSAELDELKLCPKVLETVPQWAVDAPRLDTPLHLTTRDHPGPKTAEDKGVDPFMVSKNVLIWRLHIFFT